MSPRFDRTAATGDHIVFTLDLAGNFKFVNRAGELMMGYSCEELRRLKVRDLLPETSAADLAGYIRGTAGRRFGSVFEMKVTTRYGRRIRLEFSVELVRRPDRSREFECIAIPIGNAGRAARPRPRCLDMEFRQARDIAGSPGWLAYE